MRTTRLHRRGFKLRPLQVVRAIDETIAHHNVARSARRRHSKIARVPAEKISRKILELSNGSKRRDGSSISVEKRRDGSSISLEKQGNGRGRRPLTGKIQQDTKEKRPRRVDGKLGPSAASPHLSKRITRSMHESLDDLKTIILQHEVCSKRKKSRGHRWSQSKRQQQQKRGRVTGVIQKENLEPFQRPSDGAEDGQLSTADSNVRRRFKQRNVSIGKPQVLISSERERKTGVATRRSQKDQLIRKQNKHQNNARLTEIILNDEKAGSPEHVPEKEPGFEEGFLKNENAQVADGKRGLYNEKHKKMKTGQTQELFRDSGKQRHHCHHEVSRLTDCKQNGVNEVTGIVNMMRRGAHTRVMKRGWEMESYQHEKCTKEQTAFDTKEIIEEIVNSDCKTSLAKASVERRWLRSMDNIHAGEEGTGMKQFAVLKGRLLGAHAAKKILANSNPDAVMDDGKSIKCAGDGSSKICYRADDSTTSQLTKDEGKLIRKRGKRKLKKTSFPSKADDSGIEVRLQLEPGVNYFKDTEQWFDKTESTDDNQSKLLSVTPLNHQQKEMAIHGSGSMDDDQRILDKYLVVDDASGKFFKETHMDGSFSPGETERHTHAGQTVQLERNIQADPKFETLHALSNTRAEENTLGAEIDNRNKFQAVLGVDQACNQFTVDDSDNHNVGFKRKRMRGLNNLVGHFESSIGYEKDDYGKSDGVCKVDSERMHFWVAANPKETGGRQMRPRLLYADQPLLILVEGRDQDYYNYDGGLLHQMLVEQEAEVKSFEKAALTRTAGASKKDSQVQAVKKENILIPSFKVLLEFEGLQMDMKSDYILPKSYIKHTESILDECEAEYDMDEDDEEWLQNTNKTRLHSDLPPLSDSQFEKIIEMLEVKYAQYKDQEKGLSFPEIGQRTQNEQKSEEPYESESPNDVATLAMVQQLSEDCCICNGGENSNFNPVFTCSDCHIIVHQSCYGILETLTLDDELRNNWICRKCEAVMEGKIESDVCCSLCCKKGGALKPAVQASKWVHVVCALYTDETYFVDTDAMEPVDGLAAAEARAHKQKRSCCLCGMKGGCLERCCARGCNARFHVSCGVNQGASFQLRHSNQQVVGVRSFCSKHANVAPVATPVKDAVLGSKKERGDHLRGKRKHLSWKRKHRDLSRLSIGEDERTTLEQHSGLATNSETDAHDNQNIAARQESMRQLLVEKRIQSGFQESCRVLEEPQISSGQEKDPAALLSVEDALEINIAPSHDLVEVYWYWISKKARLGGFLLHKLQQEHAATKYCIFNKDEDDLSPLHMEHLSTNGTFNLEANEQQRLASVKVHLEKLQHILRLVIHREKLKFQIFSVELDIVMLKLNALEPKKSCTWCGGIHNLVTCTICWRNFCYQCCKRWKGCGVKGWATAYKTSNFICTDCRLRRDEQAKSCKSMKDETCEGFRPGLDTIQVEEKFGSIPSFLDKSMPLTHQNMPLTGVGDSEAAKNKMEEEVPLDSCVKQVELHHLVQRPSKADDCLETSHKLMDASSTDLSRKSLNSKTMEDRAKYQNEHQIPHVKTDLLSELLNLSCTYANGKAV